MTSKKLRPRTIIPDPLYVDREADRQLEAIVEDMGRPGYVLVARQMGKTNLLLRMKRKRESLGERVIYMDLSIPFETAESLFRAIIDRITDQLEDAGLTELIDSERVSRKVDPNAEFDRHLRLCLRSDRSPRTIIILDEIDSLVGNAYSDKILSQIRSMYFARTNFEVYDRLTYVLSGVAEPTDLIKDRNISPFNIGEKIYLNDFTREEIDVFVAKADLTFPVYVKDAIYDWTNGNPRMTWDVVSALEDLQLSGEDLSQAHVEASIKRLYLTRFDRAPIDHIRTLAESDAQIRSALISLLYGKGDALDDKAKSKLYLAGITTPAGNSAPQIRNKVLEKALSEEWLVQIKAGRIGLIHAADQRFAARDFEAVVDLHKQYLSRGGTHDELSDVQMLHIGLAYFNCSALGEAINSFTESLNLAKSKVMRSAARFHLALSRILSDEVEAGTSLLEETVRERGAYSLQARLQLINIKVAAGLDDEFEDVEGECRALIADLDDDDNIEEEAKPELVAAAYFNIAQSNARLGKLAEATAAVQALYDTASEEQLPGLSLALFGSGINWEGESNALRKTVKLIVANAVPLSSSPMSFSFKEADVIALMCAGDRLGQFDLIDELVSSHLNPHTHHEYEYVLDLAYSTSKSVITESRVTLFRLSIDRFGLDARSDGSKYYQTLKNILLLTACPGGGLSNDAQLEAYRKKLFSTELVPFFDADGVMLLARYFRNLVQSGRFADIDQLLQVSRKILNNDTIKGTFYVPLLMSYEMNYYRAVFDEDNARRTARDLLRLTSSFVGRLEGGDESYQTYVKRLRDNATETIALFKRTSAARAYGRNEIVRVVNDRTGIVTSVKFKKVESAIGRGDLRLLED